MRVLLDGTPLLGQRTGIGRYTASLIGTLARESAVDVDVVGFTARGWRRLRAMVPEGSRAVGLPVPARALRACWSRMAFPPVELLAPGADVVHGTNFVLPPSARARGVVTVHDLDFLDSPAELADRERGLPELVGRSVRGARVVCTPTAAVAEKVCERYGLERSKVAVTPLGVDPAWFEAVAAGPRLRRKHRLPDDYLLFVGADGPRKGLDTLLRAHDDELPELVVAGPGGAGTGAIRTGYLAEAELRRVVAGARALVLPSRDEGFGLPVLEALACGVPVVCSDVPALREVSGGQAELFDPGDAESVRAALHRAVARPRDPAADTARRDRAARFTWHDCARATLEAYHRAL